MERKPVVYPLLPAYVHGPMAMQFHEWATIVEEYESGPDSLHAAWLYLGHHPAFWSLRSGVDGSTGHNLVTGTAWYQSIEIGVEDNNQVWLEIFPSLWPEDPTWEEFHAAAPHLPDWRLNITANTYEEVVKLAAAIVHGQYGNDREFMNSPFQYGWIG
jgi:hypothetical protein